VANIKNLNDLMEYIRKHGTAPSPTDEEIRRLVAARPAPLRIPEFEDSRGRPCMASIDHTWATPAGRHPPCEYEDREIIRELEMREQKEKTMPQTRLFVKDLSVRYEAGRPDGVEVTVTVQLPPSADPNTFVNWLKAGDLGRPLSCADPPEIASLRQQLSVAGNRVKVLEEQLRDRQKKHAESEDARRTAEAVALQLRERMNIAAEALTNRQTAADLYSELLNRWSGNLAEGATFTVAEGEDLVVQLVEMLHYIQTSAAVLAEEPSEPAETGNRTEQLF